MTVSFCWPWIFFEQTNYMMIDPRKLPNSTSSTNWTDSADASSFWLVTCFLVARSVQSVEPEQVFVPFQGSRCRKSIKEIIVSVFQWRDDPRQQMSVCFTISITTFDLEQITVTAQPSPVIHYLLDNVQVSLWRIYTHGPIAQANPNMLDCSISPSWHKTVQFG